MNQFYKNVYEIVSIIPIGKVVTYGQIAALLGNPRASRAVGWAMRSAPEYLKLPCHRVVNRKGELAPDYVFGGKSVQKAMLEEEGIVFEENDIINMREYLYKF